ncbi:hypothetical protein ACKGJI_04020 [Sulfurospirillum sp. 1307]|jgi:hypothetical protein
MKIIFALFVIFINLFAQNCNDEYSNKKYLTSPENFSDIVEVKFDKWFDKKVSKDFIKIKNNYYKKNSYKIHKDYIYPIKSGIWKLHIDKNNLIDEIWFAKVLNYQNDNESMSNEINDDLDHLWLDWNEDQYEAIMQPEDIKLHVDNFFITLNLYMYGNKDNQLKIKKSTLNFHMINNTHEVNNFLKCIQGLN